MHFAEKLEEFRLVDDPKAWGWGNFFATRRSRGALAAAAARRSLDVAGIGPNEVDAVMLCAAEFPGTVEEHGTLCREVLGDLSLARAVFLGVTLARCNTMLVGLELAARLVAARVFGTILVAASDVVADERRRFQRHALFSDGAASCLIRRRAACRSGGFAVLASESLQAPARMDGEAEIGGDLGRAANAAIEARTGIAPREVVQ
ncbi:hypothetical protein, partial [uncultured Methylobacterium sp.]|uniref:hypothetical protein n=1 Tax=uncultured Methylobacterium sp. TaxID=157278 RepID=UPI002587524A